MPYKPLGNRCILKINKKYLFEGKKPIFDDSGSQAFDIEKEGTVMVSNIEGLKKGMVVIPIIRGGVPITSEENKKHIVLVIDSDDIYAYKA